MSAIVSVFIHQDLIDRNNSMNTKTRIWFSVLSLILMMGLSPLLFAAETTSSIKGNVYDGSGNPMAGAAVVV